MNLDVLDTRRGNTERRSEEPAERKNALRIALVQTQAENAGAQEVSRLLARGLEQRGHVVRQIFLFRKTGAFDAAGDAVFCSPERPSGIIGGLRLLIRLRHELSRMRADTVLAFQHFGNIIAAPVARSLGIRTIIANQVSAGAAVARWVRLADAAIGAGGGYDRVVVNSRETERAYARYHSSYSDRLVRIDHGFEDKSGATGKIQARIDLGLPNGVPLLGCAARLHPLKRLDVAIGILAVNRDQHLALAGQGPDRPRLEDLADTLAVRSRLHFLGELAPDRMGLFLAALDCFVFPSAAESFGLAPVEAAQAGLPVVASALPVLRDVLAVDGEPCALFAEPPDSDTFAAAVRTVLSDANLAARLHDQGRRLKDRYPLQAMIDSYAELVETMGRGR